MTADMMARAAAPPKQPSMRRLIVAATIGNVFEWFDFVVYGFFAVTLAEVFFPAGDPTVSLLITFGAFALAYFVRPLGCSEKVRYLRSRCHVGEPACQPLEPDIIRLLVFRLGSECRCFGSGSGGRHAIAGLNEPPRSVLDGSPVHCYTRFRWR